MGTLPTPEEERVLFARYQEGDIEAGHQLVLGHGGLWASLAHRYAPAEDYYIRDERAATAWVLALEALPTFDPTKSKFSSYIGTRVQGGLLDRIRSERRTQRKDTEFAQNTTPTWASLQQEPIEDAFTRKVAYQQLHAIIGTLSPLLQAIVTRRWLSYDEPTHTEIGKELGVSRTSIRRLEDTALTKIREKYETMGETCPIPRRRLT